ncbi:MAG TPA: polysaccharide biosynthesis tyrosine autokinase, partial [Humisphaera sp.]
MTTLPQTAPIRVPRPIPASGQMVAHAPGPLGFAGDAARPPVAGGLTPADIWRVIRANMLLIIVALLLGSVTGWFVNSLLLRYAPKYKASGYLVVRSPNEMPEPMIRAVSASTEELSLLQRTHAQSIEHVDSLLPAAIQASYSAADAGADPKKQKLLHLTTWYQNLVKDEDGGSGEDRKTANAQRRLAEGKRDLEKNLSATPIGGTRLIKVEYTAADPRDAVAVLTGVINPYLAKIDEQYEVREKSQMELLRQEKARLEFELDQVVRRQLSAKEQELGLEGVELFGTYNSKRLRYDRMVQASTEARATLAGLNVQKDNLDRALRDGKVPAEVQSQLSRDGRYLSAKDRVDMLELEIKAVTLEMGQNSPSVIRLKKRQQDYQELLDRIREELRSEYADVVRTMLDNQLMTADANAKLIQKDIDDLNVQMGKLNQTVEQYRLLKTKEARLRDDIERFDREVRRVAEFRLGSAKEKNKQLEWQNLPEPPDMPTFPQLKLTMPMSIVVFLALALGIAFLRELTDTSVRSPRDIAKVGQLTLLGIVPHSNDDPESQASGRLPLAILDAPNSHVAEQFRQMRTRLQYAHSLDTTRSLLVTSPSPDDGKTTVAVNLAAALALNGRRILLVDANFRRPTLHGVFNAANDSGFGDVLTNLDLLPTAARDTEVPNLSVLVAGSKPTNPTELLESQYFVDFVERALEEYDHVVFDSGPLLMVSDAVAMAPRVDGVI